MSALFSAIAALLFLVFSGNPLTQESKETLHHQKNPVSSQTADQPEAPNQLRMSGPKRVLVFNANQSWDNVQKVVDLQAADDSAPSN